jgi:hypothetical protein
MEIYGTPNEEVLKLAQRRDLFFHKNTCEPILSPNTRGKIRQPASKKI